MIEVDGLEKRFGDVVAVRDVSFVVGRGEIVGFLGPNGAGKTTTMRIIAGVFPPTTGRVRIAGHDPMGAPLECRRRVGYFPEFAPHYPELTVAEFLDFVARVKRVAVPADAVDAVVTTCVLDAVVSRRVGTLSKGYRQRVGLAQALLGDPPILVLDEPTIGLDPEQVVEIRELIRGLGADRTVLFSSHILSEVEVVSDRVVVIADGRLVAEGTPSELSRRLGRQQRVVVRVDGDPVAIESALRAIPDLVACAAVGTAWHLDAAADRDLTAEIADLVSARRWRMRELRQEALALEEIFLHLVRGEGDE